MPPSSLACAIIISLTLSDWNHCFFGLRFCPSFTKHLVKELVEMLYEADADEDNELNFVELCRLLEVPGAPVTHLDAKICSEIVRYTLFHCFCFSAPLLSYQNFFPEVSFGLPAAACVAGTTIFFWIKTN
eukprot:NP_001033530.1 Uncharacterized protein CELE_C36C9.6 [Caenorhabditis elegans]